MANKDQLNDFIDHVEAWKKNSKEYIDWVKKETKNRIEKYDGIQRRTRNKLIKNIDTLNFDKEGRAKSSSIGDRTKINKFRKNTDKAIGKMTKNGKKNFGMNSKIDKKTGMNIGDMDAKLKAETRRRLWRMYHNIRLGLKKSKSKEFRDMVGDFDAFINSIEELLGEHGRKLAENIAANLNISIRPTRNKLEESPRQRKTKAQISDDTQLELTKKQKQALKVSFDVHLKALAREAADKFAQQIKAKKFIGLNPYTDETESMKFSDYRNENLATLGPHPNSDKIAIPVHPKMDTMADDVVEIVKETGEKRKKAIEGAFD